MYTYVTDVTFCEKVIDKDLRVFLRELCKVFFFSSIYFSRIIKRMQMYWITKIIN